MTTLRSIARIVGRVVGWLVLAYIALLVLRGLFGPFDPNNVMF